jgi:hypothetical protein
MGGMIVTTGLNMTIPFIALFLPLRRNLALGVEYSTSIVFNILFYFLSRINNDRFLLDRADKKGQLLSIGKFSNGCGCRALECMLIEY